MVFPEADRDNLRILKTHTQEYRGDFLERESTDYGNEKENNWESSHQYWVDLDNRKALTSSCESWVMNAIQQGDILVLSGGKVSDSLSTYVPVDTVKITINLMTMEAQTSHKVVHFWDGIDSDDLHTHHYSFLNGKCRYEENFLDHN